MQRRHRHMQGIGCRRRGHATSLDQQPRQTNRRLVRQEYSTQLIKHCFAASDGGRITRHTFIVDDIRNVAIKLRGNSGKPIPCQFLMDGRHPISAQAPREVADDGGFQVNLRLHGDDLTTYPEEIPPGNSSGSAPVRRNPRPPPQLDPGPRRLRERIAMAQACQEDNWSLGGAVNVGLFPRAFFAIADPYSLRP